MAAEIQAIITAAARKYGVPPEYAIRISDIETGGTFDPKAQNKESSAGGLFQFTNKTWGQYGGGAHKYDPHANADAGARFIRDNMNALRRGLGREPTLGEVYMAHQQGAGGALRILKGDPNANASQTLGRDHVRLNLPGPMRGQADTITTGQFAKLWDDKVNAGTKRGRSSSISPTLAAGNADNTFNVDNPSARVRMGMDAINTDTQPTFQQQLEARREAEKRETPGFWEGVGMSFEADSTVLTPWRMLGKNPPDPNWGGLTPERVKELGQGIPDQYLEEFVDAVSDEHAVKIRDRLARMLEIEGKLDQMGWYGVGIRVGVGVLDPGAWAAMAAVTAASGGVGLPAAMALRFGRLGQVAHGAVAAATGSALSEIPVVLTNPTLGKGHLMASVGAGLVLGGAFGAFARNPLFHDDAAAMAKAGGKIIERENAKVIPNAADTIAAEGSTAGAAQVPKTTKIRSDQEEMADTFDVLDKMFVSVFGKGRFDIAYELKTHPNSVYRVMGSFLVEDAGRSKKGSGVKTALSASEGQARLMRVHSAQWLRGYQRAWSAYRKENNIGFLKTNDGVTKFNREVVEYARAKDPAVRDGYSDAVKEAGSHYKKMMDSWWKLADEEGLTRSRGHGVEDYVPRYPDLGEVHRVVKEVAAGDLQEFVTQSIMRAQRTIPKQLAGEMGSAIIRRLSRMAAGEEATMSRILGGEDLDGLRKILKDENWGDRKIDALMKKMDKDAGNNVDAGGSARLKQRILLDENFEMNVRTKDGTSRKIKMSDFYIADINKIAMMYNRQMSGQIALARIKVPNPFYDAADPKSKQWIVDGIRDDADFNRIKEIAMAVGQETDAEAFKAGWKKMEFIYNSIRGVPNWDESGIGANALRMMRNFNFFRIMGQVGFAQLPEMGRITSAVGLKAAFHAMPSAKALFLQARSGKMMDALAEELDAIGAFGTDYLRNKFFLRTDNDMLPIALNDGNKKFNAVADFLDPKLHALNKAVAMGSFMAPVNAFLQTWASRALALRFVKLAKTGKGWSSERLLALGLDDVAAKRIIDNINLHAVGKNGADLAKKPHKLEKLGLDKWDIQARADFEEAMFRAARTVILEQDRGQMMKWMDHPLGKMVIQFRSFSIGAYTKAMMQGLNMRDAEAGMAFLTSTFIGGLVYTGQTYANSLGMNEKDRQEYLAKRITLLELAKAGFLRTSESSLLPLPFDMVSEMITGDPFFSYQRGSGLSGSIAGIPTVNFIDSASQAVKGVTTAIGGDDYSKEDAQAALRAFASSRLTGFIQFSNWLVSDMPRERKD
jgi:hypothetical protein